MRKLKNIKEGRKEKKRVRNVKKELKKKIKYLKKRINCCSAETLSEILEEIENNPYLNKKKLKALIAKRIDSPPEIIERLKRDTDGEVRFWAHDTEIQRFSLERK